MANVEPQTPEDASPAPELDADIARLTRLRESPPDGATPGQVAAQLGLQYLRRARRDGHLPDFDQAVAWLTQGYAELAAGSSSRDKAAVLLAAVTLDRFRARQAAGGDDRERARRELDEAVASLEPLVATGASAAAELAVVRGAVRLQQAEVSGRRDDLDHGIAELETASAALPPDSPYRMGIGPMLALAHGMRATHAARAAAAAGTAAGDIADAASADPAQAGHEAASGRYASEALRSGVLDDGMALLMHYRRLSAAVDRLEAADNYLADGSPDPDLAPALAECERCLAEAGAMLDRAVDVDPLVLAPAAGFFAIIAVQLATFGGALPDPERVTGWLALAGRHPDPPPHWRDQLDLVGHMLRLATSTGQPAGSTVGTEPVDQAASDLRAMLGEDNLRSLLAAVRGFDAMRTADRRGAQAVSEVDWDSVDPSRRVTVDQALVQGLRQALERVRQRDGSGTAEALDRVEALVDSRAGSPDLAQAGRSAVHLLRRLIYPDDPLGSPPAGPVRPGPDANLFTLAAAGLELQTRLLEAGRRQDAEALRSTGRDAVELAGRVASHPALRLLTAMTAAEAYLGVARADTADHAAAESAVRWSEEAVGLLDGNPTHPHWPVLAMLLASSIRQAGGDLPRSRHLAMSALQGYAWQVLRQAGTDVAVEVAAWATLAVHQLAHWCLADGATDEVVAALDAGRGLVLDAATASRDVASELAARGHSDLAARWRATAGLGHDRLTGAVLSPTGTDQIPDDLRLQALQALRDGDPASWPSAAADGVGNHEIRHALSTLGADALVYLLPPGEGPGAAVIVPVAGAVDTVRLPGLGTRPDPRAARHAATTRDAARATVAPGVTIPAGTAVTAGAANLDGLYRWAWQAAAGPLIDYTSRWHLHRPARLVLVATRSLALMPWHAAYAPEGTGRRYALADLVISYAVSARMMCQIAARPTGPARSALIVGDPTGDLPAAGAEARAIHHRFYPDATYLGHSPTGTPAGAGTPDEVSTWIDQATGPSLLHFACHGHVEPGRPGDSHLALAGGRLTARDLLEASRLSTLQVERVFLAACTTSHGGATYDEAFSLATAFLAAGAGTVIGSLWRVPDTATSLLMYVVHHNLTVNALPPADALRGAQLWMLDPHRRPPAGMPADLAGQCDRPDAADPISWAGFIHFGR